MPQAGLEGRVLGQYRIIEKIGSGGMADVYKGIQVGLDREVAVKVLPLVFATDREMVRRFRRESQSIARFSHPNIITIYDSGEEDGYFYYAMEYLQADSLEDVLEVERPLAIPRALKITQDILKALTYIHQNHIIHRDLKPGNIKFDSRGNAIVTDFGLVKDLEATGITKAGMAVGTPLYFPPEQIDGEPIDCRADLYQTGLILYEMVTGRTAIQVDPKAKLSISKLRPGNIPRASELNPLVGAALSDFIHKALKARPQDRFGSAKEMLAELKHVELKERARTSGTPGKNAGPNRVSRPPVVRPWPFMARLGSALAAVPWSFLLVLAGLGLAGGGVFRLYSSKQQDPVVFEQTRDVESNRAVITWRTEPACFSEVEYWPAGARLDVHRTDRAALPSSEHRQTLTGLKPDSRYSFRFLLSRNPRGEDGMTATEVYIFTTQPEIRFTKVSVEDVLPRAILRWETNLNTDTVVRYGRTDAYGEMQSDPSQYSATSHSIELGGLTPQSTYHFQIVATTPGGKIAPASSQDFSFHTTGAPQGAGPRARLDPTGSTALIP